MLRIGDMVIVSSAGDRNWHKVCGKEGETYIIEYSGGWSPNEEMLQSNKFDRNKHYWYIWCNEILKIKSRGLYLE